MARFYYEDSVQPWRPDGILQEYIRDRPQRHRDTEQVERALDLGMGYGRNSLWLAEQGYKVEGWERDRRYVAEAKREWRRRVCNVQPSGFAQGRRAAGLGKGKTKLETRNSKLGHKVPKVSFEFRISNIESRSCSSRKISPATATSARWSPSASSKTARSRLKS